MCVGEGRVTSDRTATVRASSPHPCLFDHGVKGCCLCHIVKSSMPPAHEVFMILV